MASIKTTSRIAATAIALAAGLLAMSPGAARAQTSGTWTTSGAATTWTNTARWQNATVASGTGATATFTVTGTAGLATNLTIGNLTTGTARVTIRSGTGSNASDLTNTKLQFATTGTPTINNAGRLDMFAVITGNQGFTKSGNGVIYLNRQNSYTGVTTISAGDVRLGAPNGLGDTGSGNGTVVQNGATVRLDNGATGQTSVQTAESFTISGTGFGNLGALRSQAGADNAFTGPITLAANSSIKANPGVGSSLTLGGSVSLGSNNLELGDGGIFVVSGGMNGTGNLSYTGTGSLTLSGYNALTGTTTVTNSGAPVAMTGYMAGLMIFTGSSRTLIGTGTIAGGLSVGASNVLSLGASGTAAADSLGTITTSTLEVQSATVVMGIQDASTYDRLVMTAGANGLTLGGTAILNLDFANLLATNFNSGLDLFNFTGLSGSFVGVTSTGAYSGAWTKSGDVFTLANVGTGNAQTLEFNQATGDVMVVPEPSTIVLLGSIAAVASLIRYRRHRAL